MLTDATERVKLKNYERLKKESRERVVPVLLESQLAVLLNLHLHFSMAEGREPVDTLVPNESLRVSRDNRWLNKSTSE